MDPRTAANTGARALQTSSTPQTYLPQTYRQGVTGQPQPHPIASGDFSGGPPIACAALPSDRPLPKDNPALVNQPTTTTPAVATPPLPKSTLTINHTTTILNDAGDEYLPREIDKLGEEKILSSGELVGDREYICRTFSVPHHGHKLFMLGAECAEVLGYRDTSHLFDKNPALYRIMANEVEKDQLAAQGIFPVLPMSRLVPIVTARSMFRQFGRRMIANGQSGRDDYWESRARKKDFSEDDLFHEKRPALLESTKVAAASASAASALNIRAAAILDEYPGHYWHPRPTRKALVSNPNPSREDAYPKPTPVQPRNYHTPMATDEAPPFPSFASLPHNFEATPPTPSSGHRSAMMPFSCDQCPQWFCRNKDLKRHKRNHHAVNPIRCGLCDETFLRHDALKHHRIVKHDNWKSELNSYVPPPGNISSPADRTARDSRIPDPFSSLQTPYPFTGGVVSPGAGLAAYRLGLADRSVLRQDCTSPSTTVAPSASGVGDLVSVGDEMPQFSSVLIPPLKISTSPSSGNQPVWSGLPDVPPNLKEPTVPSLLPNTPGPPASAHLSPLTAKAEPPLTDSGYGSAAGLAPHVHTAGHEPANDRQTQYSDGTTVPQIHARTYISELCHDISARLGDHTCLSGKVMSMLPALIKAFAIKIASYEPSQVNRDIMYFIHKHHKELTEQLSAILSREGDQTALYHQDTGDGMQIWEKMGLWHTATGADSLPKGDSDYLFGGIDDEDGELAVPLFMYSHIVLNSTAYDWFISSLKRECAQPSIALRDITNRILSKLSTTIISKHWVPDEHRASFILSRQSMGDRAILECPEVKPSPETAALFPSMLTLTSSSDDELQATPVAAYLRRTWPFLGWGLLNAIDATFCRGPIIPIKGTLADKTKFRVVYGPADMTFEVTGTAYSIAECGAQLSWLACVIHDPRANSAVCTTPIVSSLPDVINSQGVLSASFRIDVCEDVVNSSQLQGRCWYKAFDHSLFPVIVQGFPITQRPKGCPGLELSYNTMVEAFGLMPHHAPFRLERGPMCLQIVDRIGRDVFYWHDTNLPSGHGRCGSGYPRAVRRLSPGITNSDLVSGRHILCPCVSMQSDLAEEDGDWESTFATDESLSLGLASDASDSQTTEGPIETTPAYDLFKRVLRRLVLEFQGESNTSTYTGSSSANTAANGAGPPDTTPCSSVIPARCTGEKRSRGSSGDKDGDDEESPPNKKSTTGGSPCPARSALLACPFWKMDPNTHWGCYAKRLTTISYVKQHLSRNHTPSYYCQRCFTIFQHADTYEDHITATPPCTRGPSARLEGISPAQSKRLQRRAKGSVEEQWFVIWDIVFPQDRRPLFVYMDYDQSEDFASFHEFVRRRGVPIVREELEASGVVGVPGETEGRLLDGAIERALEGLFERFRSGRLSYSASSSASRTAGQHIEHPTRNEAVVARSTTDSGVGISSVFSSGGSRASDEVPHQLLDTNSFSPPVPFDSGQPQGPVTITELGATDDGYVGLSGEAEEGEFTDELFRVAGEDRFVWDDFLRECYR